MKLVLAEVLVKSLWSVYHWRWANSLASLCHWHWENSAGGWCEALQFTCASWWFNLRVLQSIKLLLN